MRAVGFVAKGEWAFTASDDRKIRLWSTYTGQLVGQEMYHEDMIREVRVSGRTILTLAGAKTVVWGIDPADHGPLLSLQHQASYGDFTPETLAFGRDGRRLLMGDHEGNTWWWFLDTGQVARADFEHATRVNSVAFSSDRERVLTASGDGTVRAWSVETGRPLASFIHSLPVRRAVFSADGRFVATASDDTAVLWMADAGTPIGSPLNHPEAVFDVAFSPDARILVTACADGLARFWSTSTGAPLEPSLDHQAGLLAVAFHPDGKQVATGGKDKTARLWWVATRQLTGVVMEHRGPVADIAFSPDGRLLATASEGDDRVRLWSPTTGELLGPSIHACCDLREVQFSPDSTRIAAVGWHVRPTVGRIASPFSGDPQRAMLQVKVLTMHKMDDQGTLRPLDTELWRACREQLGMLSSAEPNAQGVAFPR